MDRKELLSRLRESEAELSQLRLKSTELAKSREEVLRIDQLLADRLSQAEKAHEALLEDLLSGIATATQSELSLASSRGQAFGGGPMLGCALAKIAERRGGESTCKGLREKGRVRSEVTGPFGRGKYRGFLPPDIRPHVIFY
ncbi:MAG: hypothetical protein SV686_03260 [Thermodesulfobacteriota bacterium]|nr:hypothetical protein [Thermodesulfobacteriota bacterium]